MPEFRGPISHPNYHAQVTHMCFEVGAAMIPALAELTRRVVPGQPGLHSKYQARLSYRVSLCLKIFKVGEARTR